MKEIRYVESTSSPFEVGPGDAGFSFLNTIGLVISLSPP
jgi:hypothetical protein